MTEEEERAFRERTACRVAEFEERVHRFHERRRQREAEGRTRVRV
jgi:hypothetical protein